jgi:hypothetical protein
MGCGAGADVVAEADPEASLTSSDTATGSTAGAAGSSSGNTVAVGGGDSGGSDGTRRSRIRDGLVSLAPSAFVGRIHLTLHAVCTPVSTLHILPHLPPFQ